MPNSGASPTRHERFRLSVQNRPRGSSHGVLELLGRPRETVPAIADEFTRFKVSRKAGRGKIPNRVGIIARVSLPRPQPPLVWALFQRR
jgi:hypothetical protein